MRCRCHRPSPSSRKGFVLLLTVGLLLITVITTSRMAQASLRLALEAIQAEESVQERWLRASLQRVVLNRGGRHFAAAAAAEKTSDTRRKFIDADIRLGSRIIRLKLSDEDAKINLNQIHEVQGPAEVGTVVRRHATARGLTVRLLPSKVDTDETVIPYESWGQVFDLGRGGSARDIMEATRELTCWGGPRSNAARGSAAALAGRSVSNRDDRRPGSLQTLERPGESPNATNPEQDDPQGEQNVPRERPGRFVARGASCYSLWVVYDTGQCEFMLSEVVQGRRYVTSFLW